MNYRRLIANEYKDHTNNKNYAKPCCFCYFFFLFVFYHYTLKSNITTSIVNLMIPEDNDDTFKIKQNWGIPPNIHPIQNSSKYFSSSFINLNDCNWVIPEINHDDIYVIHYNSTAKYRERIPDSSYGELLFQKPFVPKNNKMLWQHKQILQHCFLKTEKFMWSIDKLGPFKTKGNYDWTIFGWKNALNFKQFLDNKNIFVKEQQIFHIDKNGYVLGTPPIHPHHIHVNLKTDISKYIGGVHGNDICYENDGGAKCSSVFFDDTRGFYIKDELSVYGEINDVREFDSPLLEYYTVIAFKFNLIEKHSHLKTVSRITYQNMPNWKYITNDAATAALTFLTPNDAPSIFWHTVYSEYEGNILKAETHSHAIAWNSTFVFSGTPEQLGIEKFISNPFGFSTPLSKLGFSNIEDFKIYLKKKYNQNKYDRSQGPVLRLKSEANSEIVKFKNNDTALFDRFTTIWCNDWNIQRGEQIVILTLFNKATKTTYKYNDFNFDKYQNLNKIGNVQHSAVALWIEEKNSKFTSSSNILTDKDPNVFWISANSLKDILMILSWTNFPPSNGKIDRYSLQILLAKILLFFTIIFAVLIYIGHKIRNRYIETKFLESEFL